VPRSDALVSVLGTATDADRTEMDPAGLTHLCSPAKAGAQSRVTVEGGMSSQVRRNWDPRPANSS